MLSPHRWHTPSFIVVSFACMIVSFDGIENLTRVYTFAPKQGIVNLLLPVDASRLLTLPGNSGYAVAK